MAVSTKVTGWIIKPTILVDCCIKMATFTKENGLLTRHMALDTISTKMVASIVASGRTTHRMAKV